MLQETRPDPPWHPVQFRVGALDIRLRTSPRPFSDANKLIKVLIVHKVVEIKVTPKIRAKFDLSAKLSCDRISRQFLPILSFAGRTECRLSFDPLLRKHGAQMETIDFVLYHWLRFEYQFVALKVERLLYTGPQIQQFEFPYSRPERRAQALPKRRAYAQQKC